MCFKTVLLDTHDTLSWHTPLFLTFRGSIFGIIGKDMAPEEYHLQSYFVCFDVLIYLISI